MKKEMFLQKRVFKIDNNFYQFATFGDHDQHYSIDRLEIHKGKILFTKYECNIEKIGSKYAYCYKYILDKLVKITLNISELNFVEL